MMVFGPPYVQLLCGLRFHLLGSLNLRLPCPKPDIAAGFDEVRSRFNRAKRPTSTLLKGLAFDGNANRLQPSFCVKKGVRYYYYTSARRLREPMANAQGLRIPAADLERLVIRATADRWQDSKHMLQ